MTPKPMPSETALAAMLSEVTSTMLGVPFQAATGEERIELLCWRSAILPIGNDVLHVAIASDEHGCAFLGARMFQVERAEVDASMIDDTLRELVNMTAGLIKRAVGPDATLGLPRIVFTTPPTRPPADWHRLLLRAQGNDPVEVVLFVSDPARRSEGAKEISP